jgi:hypothetical protein
VRLLSLCGCTVVVMQTQIVKLTHCMICISCANCQPLLVLEVGHLIYLHGVKAVLSAK